MGIRGCWRVVAAAGAVLSLAALPGSATAADWSPPVRISPGSIGPSVSVSRDGTVLVAHRGTRTLIEATRIRPRARRGRRCTVPALGRGAAIESFHWDANAAGAMALSWVTPKGEGRVTSAPSGRCFTRAFDPAPRGFGPSARVSPGGTLIVTWNEGGRPVFGSGRLGGRTHRRGFVMPRVPGRNVARVQPSFIARDRIVWSALTIEPGDPNDTTHTERLEAATSGVRAGRVGRPLEAASVTYDSLQGHEFSLQPARVVTDARGGQVAAWNDGNRFHLMSRAPGRPYGEQQLLPVGADNVDEMVAASNAAGDAVFTWVGGGEVFGLLRRRDGRVIGPQLVTPGDSPSTNEHPSVAIDARGRAIVAWIAHDREPSQLGPSEVRAAIAGRSGTFGPPEVVSGPEQRVFVIPMQVAVNAGGDAAVAWTEDHFDENANIASSDILLSRGNLGR